MYAMELSLRSRMAATRSANPYLGKRAAQWGPKKGIWNTLFCAL